MSEGNRVCSSSKWIGLLGWNVIIVQMVTTAVTVGFFLCLKEESKASRLSHLYTPSQPLREVSVNYQFKEVKAAHQDLT